MAFLKSLYLTRRLYGALIGVVLLFVAAYFAPPLMPVAQIALVAVVALFALDLVLLFHPAEAIRARRSMPDRLSNGDPNALRVHLENRYRFAARRFDGEPVPQRARRVHLPRGRIPTAAAAARRRRALGGAGVARPVDCY